MAALFEDFFAAVFKEYSLVRRPTLLGGTIRYRSVNSISKGNRNFPVPLFYHIVWDYLRYEGISTHSFRKWYATEIYNANGCDIALVQRLLQHRNAATTQRYIGIEPQRIEQTIQNYTYLMERKIFCRHFPDKFEILPKAAVSLQDTAAF